jgi:lysophospholipid acyltransferase (LPLAT)-like uncharacterized protein
MAVETDAVAHKFTLWQRLQFTMVAWAASLFVAVIGRTLRVSFSAEEGSVPNIDDIFPGIYPFWHRCVLPSVWIFRRKGLAVMTSQSRDGEFIARVISRFGFIPVRGSSSRGGQRALLEMRRIVAAGGGVAFTIDGPRGPRYVAKRGPVVLARETGAPIVPFYVALDRAWVLKTWDAMLVPKPFARAIIRPARKIHVSADADEKEMESAYAEMQAALERVTAAAEAATQGLKPQVF